MCFQIKLHEFIIYYIVIRLNWDAIWFMKCDMYTTVACKWNVIYYIFFKTQSDDICNNVYCSTVTTLARDRKGIIKLYCKYIYIYHMNLIYHILYVYNFVIIFATNFFHIIIILSS